MCDGHKPYTGRDPVIGVGIGVACCRQQIALVALGGVMGWFRGPLHVGARPRGGTERGRALDPVRRLPDLLMRTAEVLESSSRLAEQHGERGEVRGRLDAAARERDIARRARAAAQRARAEGERRAV